MKVVSGVRFLTTCLRGQQCRVTSANGSAKAFGRKLTTLCDLQVRIELRRNPDPTAGSIDSQSVNSKSGALRQQGRTASAAAEPSLA